MSGFPGYLQLKGPEALNLGNDVRGNTVFVQSAADYEWWQKIMVTRSKGQVWTALTEIRARINHGRWIADCHYCHKGMLTRPDWGIACCAQCGAYYAAGFVRFPEDPRIEALIKLRPDPTTQNWDDKQTAVDLQRENEELQLCS